jgi:hypothetical protein
MRQHLFSLLILITASTQAYSQENLQMQRLNISCDTLVLQTTVSFSFGYGTSCPQLEYFETSSNADTMELKLYYNVSGFWPQVGCGQIDTITTLILPSSTVLKGTAFALSELDTSAVSSSQIDLCSTSGIESSNSYELIAIYPNPFTSELKIYSKLNEHSILFIYDCFGQLVMRQTCTNNNSINTEQLNEGLYFYELRNENGILSSGKLVKE